MKRNAIIRIVLWSIVLVVLSAILFTGIFGIGRRDIIIAKSVEEASIPAPLSEDFQNSVPEETRISQYTSSEQNAFPAENISNLDIEWVSGNILIQPIESDQILIKEDGLTDPKYTMVYSVRQNTLKIEFCEESLMEIGFGIRMNNVSKDLTVYVPMDWVCNTMEVAAASAALEVNDLTIRNVEFDGASGTCEFENCDVDKMDIDTASGDIRFAGSLNILDCDAASASIYAVLTNVPSRLDLDSMSGDLDITLPGEAGFTLSMDALRSDFTTDFETTANNGNHVAGDGSCRINVDAMSGDVIIRKGT